MLFMIILTVFDITCHPEEETLDISEYQLDQLIESANLNQTAP